ncbi:MAG: transposase [Sphingomonadaceae bacterium]|nr:transposase [Sphingomonadaceae bacterium]
MPDYRRWFVPGGTNFFTANLLRKDSRLLTDQIDAFRAAYAEAARAQRFETVAICVLPNHVHCIWTLPDGDSDFSGRWRRIKSGFSRQLPREADLAPGRRPGERGIWQRRFWEHVITDTDDLAQHVAYVHGNPVKHRLVTEMDDWPYSSWHRWKRENAGDTMP